MTDISSTSAASTATLDPPTPIVNPDVLTVTIRPWIDPIVDDHGHDPRSRYVEQFWLGVIGPTATWLLRRLVAGFGEDPDGYEIDLVATARAMGMTYSTARSSAFTKAIDRCTMFGLAHQTSDGLAVRRRLPPVTDRQLRRLPHHVRQDHERWQHTPIDVDRLTRAHRLALVMAESGDDLATIEHHLVALGVSDSIAADVVTNRRDLADAE